MPDNQAAAADELPTLRQQLADETARREAAEAQLADVVTPAAAPAALRSPLEASTGTQVDALGNPWSPPRVGAPVAYRATEAVYVDGVLYNEGDTVVTGQVPSRTLVPIDPVEKATVEAGKDIPDDVNLSDMSAAELKAFAAAKGINIGQAKSRADLITVIGGWSDPTR
jgi:hypothetical protein